MKSSLGYFQFQNSFYNNRPRFLKFSDMTIVLVKIFQWQPELGEKYLIWHGINMPSLILFKLKMTKLQAYLAVAMATLLTKFLW